MIFKDVVVGNTPRRTFHRGKIFVILKKGVGDLVRSAVTIGRSGFGRFLSSPSPRVRFSAMDFLHSQLAKLQKHLAFVQVDPINWKGYVQGFSWSVTLFKTYLLLPLYNKTEPPAVLAPYFKDDDFQKSQAYGKDKAKFSILSGLFKQLLNSAMIHYGFYAWAWGAAGQFLTRFGYGPQYEVSLASTKCPSLSTSH